MHIKKKPLHSVVVCKNCYTGLLIGP